MEKRPVKRMNTDIERADDKKEIELFNPIQKMNQFISFKYSYREVSSLGGKTYLKAKEKSFADGKFKSEEFEGVAPANIYNNMVTEMQKMFFGQISSVLNMFSGFLPIAKKDKRD
jgi:hypothetical protein